jgi:hypothetical protein
LLLCDVGSQGQAGRLVGQQLGHLVCQPGLLIFSCYYVRPGWRMNEDELERGRCLDH